MAYLSSRVVLLTFLYFIQGLPYGLQARFLPVYLRARGHSLTSLGLFKVLLAPWLCKALWAPLVDCYATKRHWLLGSVCGLMVTCAVTSLLPPDNVLLLCVAVFALNLFAATQDIAVDSIAVAILPPDELGKGNTAQVVGYKIGAIFGGGILVWFMDLLGWMGLFLALTLLYIEAMLFVYLSPTLRTVGRVWPARAQDKAAAAVAQEDIDGDCDAVVEDDIDEPDDDPFATEAPGDKLSCGALSRAKQSLQRAPEDVEEELCSGPIAKIIKRVESKKIAKLVSLPEITKNHRGQEGLDREETARAERSECSTLPDHRKEGGDRDDNAKVEKTQTVNEEQSSSPCVSAREVDALTGTKRAEHLERTSRANTHTQKRETSCADVEQEVDGLGKDNAAAVGDALSTDNECVGSRGVETNSHMKVVSQSAETVHKGVSLDSKITDALNSDERKPPKEEDADGSHPEDEKGEGTERTETDEEAYEGKKVEKQEDEEGSQRDQDVKEGEKGSEHLSVQSTASDEESHVDKKETLEGHREPSEVERKKEVEEEEEQEQEIEEDEEKSPGVVKATGEQDDDSSDTMSQDSFTCSSVRVSGKMAFLWNIFTVPDTRWIMVYLLLYKLGEQGALGMLPLFLIDQRVKTVDVTFWTGVVGQATSILGSCLGGWILSHPIYRLPCRLLIYQLSLFRLLPLGMLLWVVMLWSGALFSPTLLYRAAIVAMNLLLLVSGMVTTATFTLMMECSQRAPSHIQATHYTILSSLEVFGKLSFMSVCGALVDQFGFTTMYLCFVLLSAGLLPWLWRYPDILCEKKQS